MFERIPLRVGYEPSAWKHAASKVVLQDLEESAPDAMQSIQTLNRRALGVYQGFLRSLRAVEGQAQAQAQEQEQGQTQAPTPAPAENTERRDVAGASGACAAGAATAAGSVCYPLSTTPMPAPAQPRQQGLEVRLHTRVRTHLPTHSTHKHARIHMDTHVYTRTHTSQLEAGSLLASMFNPSEDQQQHESDETESLRSAFAALSRGPGDSFSSIAELVATCAKPLFDAVPLAPTTFPGEWVG